MKTETLDLNKMGLSAITDADKTGIIGGGFWAIYEAIGYTLGVIVGVSINVAKETVSKHL